MLPIGSAPSIPPRPGVLAQAAPTLLGVVGGVAGAVLGSIVPGASAVVGTLVGTTVGGSVGTLFRRKDDARITADWQKDLADALLGVPEGLPGAVRSEALQGQVALAGFGHYGARPGALGISVPGLRGEALQKLLR